jgi:ferric-dicitrate binding protein FerR (iron transport regulator)
MRIVVLLLTFLTISFSKEVAGEISKLRGSALILRGGDTLVAKQKMEIFSKDMVVTQAKTKVKLKFVDNTKIMIGQNSVFEVQDYLFKKKQSKAKFKVRHGIFSAVTGKIGKIANQNFKLRVKTATIGVRGTEFEGEIGEGKEKVACTKGAITVEAKGKTIVLNEGESLDIKPEMFEDKKPLLVIGKVIDFSGGVFLIREKKTLFASDGFELNSGDIVASSNYGKATIELINGEKLIIGKLSSFQVFLDSVGGKVASLKGKVDIRDASKKRKVLRQGEMVGIIKGNFKGDKRKYSEEDNVGQSWIKKK